MSIKENMPLNWYSSVKKKIAKDSDNFRHRKLTLKVSNQHFTIELLRTYVVEKFLDVI